MATFPVNITPGSGASPITPQEFYAPAFVVATPSYIQLRSPYFVGTVPRDYPRLASYSWVQSLLETTLAPAPLGQPGSADWPLTPAAYRIEQTTAWNQMPMLGLDRLPVGAQATDLPPRAPQRLPYYGTEWRQALYLGQDVVPGKQVYDLTPHRYVPFRPEQTWTWRQVDKIGQDILPTGVQVFELAPKPPQRLPYYGWEWSQIRMIGQDQLPVGSQVADLPPRGPYRLDQTWTWRQVGMAGQDILPFGRIVYDLPTKAPYRIEQTWIWRQVDKIGLDVLPFNQFDWPVPRPPPRLDQTWTLNLQETTLQPTTAKPFFQSDWPVPRAPYRIDQTWTWDQTLFIGQDILPHNQSDWPLPGRPPRLDQTTTWSQTRMLGQDQLPVGIQITDLTPRAPPRLDQTWTWRQTIMLGQDILPFNQYYWPVPIAPPTTAYRSWEFRQVQMLGQDQLPVGAQSYALPTPAPLHSVDLYNWVQSVNLALTVTQAQLPFNQYDWPLPRAPQQAALGWTWRNVDKLSLDVLPKNQYDWPVPKGPPPLIKSWEWRNVQMLGQDVLPVGQRIYDRPVPAPVRSIDLYTWIQTVNLSLTVIQQPMPGVSDWPLVQPAARQAALGWAWNQLDKLSKDVFPRNQYDWPLPNRGPFQPDRSSTYTSPFIPIPPVRAQYFLLQPHYIFDTLLPSWTIVTEGVEVPLGWVPTLMVDPLNAQAVAAFYAAGPRTGYVGPNYDWQGFQHFTAQRQAAIQSPNTFWIPAGNGMFKLTGLGAALPPVGE